MENIRTIRVTGKGQIRVRPDTTCLTLTLEGASPEYADAVELSRQNTQLTKDALTPHGFEQSDIKTLSFGVEPQYESYREDGAYRQRLTGYRFRHVLKVEFPSDNARLGAILSALSDCPAQPEIGLSFTVADPERVKNELIRRAVSDAKEKAAALTAAAGVRLGDILSIDYSWGAVELEVRPMARVLRANVSEDAAMDIEPDDIESTDTVTVVWQIEE